MLTKDEELVVAQANSRSDCKKNVLKQGELEAASRDQSCVGVQKHKRPMST